MDKLIESFTQSDLSVMYRYSLLYAPEMIKYRLRLSGGQNGPQTALEYHIEYYIADKWVFERVLADDFSEVLVSDIEELPKFLGATQGKAGISAIIARVLLS